MRKTFQSLLGTLLLLVFMTSTGYTQKKEKNTSSLKTMEWTSKSDEAKKLAAQGAGYFMNVEYPQAYEKFKEALKLDPNFTVPLVFLANITQGETRKEYAERAVKSAADKTEGEKLFASVVKTGNTQETNRATWAKLHEMFPDGSMLGYFYVATRPTADERFLAAQQYIAQFPNNAPMYNTIAYYYMQDKKDMENAKKYLEKYMELYPDGYNPYDSMGEYYMTAGDMANAKKYYLMAVEKYPFSNSSLLALQKINDNNKKQVSNNQ